jgi:hypothetical protein
LGYGVEFPIALFDAARPLVPGKRGADMVGASALACSGDFLLRLAGCQRKDLVVEVRRTVFAASGFCSRRGRAPVSSRWSDWLRCRNRRSGAEAGFFACVPLSEI